VTDNEIVLETLSRQKAKCLQVVFSNRRL